MGESFFERPILNSPYEVPKLHHALDADGQPLDVPAIEGRRRSELITPVPKPRKKKNEAEQGTLVFSDDEGLTTAEQEYNPSWIKPRSRREDDTLFRGAGVAQAPVPTARVVPGGTRYSPPARGPVERPDSLLGQD
jgi:hypothetical protein